MPLVMSQKLALYRILQEQLNNVVKHAEATKVQVGLSQLNDDVVLTVKDNGKGFDSTLKSNGMGLKHILSRAKVFGGTVQLDTSLQRGCLLSVTVPIVSSFEQSV